MDTRSRPLPKGLSLSESGIISGTPIESGSYTFTVKATNANGKYSKAFTLKVNEATITITTASFAKGTAGAKYSKTLKATGAESFMWSISSGSLPEGLSLSETTGKIIVTLTKAGKFTFTVKASANDASCEKKFSLTIVKAMSISGNLSDSAILNPYSATLMVTVGVSPYTWTTSKGTLLSD